MMLTFRLLEYKEAMLDTEKAAGGFLELASEQRLAILLKLQEGPTKVTTIAKELGATVPEVFRNFERLSKADLILKNADGTYGITTIGTMLCSQVSLFDFISNNKKYFKNHDLYLPSKFLQRLGVLQSGKHVKGFVKVQEKWKSIYDTTEKYIYNILFEVPYTTDITQLLVKKINSGVALRSIFSESAIVPKERRQALEKFKELIQQGKIERKMQQDVKVIVILNEKEAGVMFPKSGEVDMSEGFFSDDIQFHEWCLDYFKDCWEKAGPFRETKLKE